MHSSIDRLASDSVNVLVLSQKHNGTISPAPTTVTDLT